MQAPKLPAMFSLFRQRGARGFDLPTRYYDAEKEEREKRHRASRESSAETKELFRERLHHSWHRERSNGAHLQRLVIIIGVVTAILYFIVKAFGLVRF